MILGDGYINDPGERAKNCRFGAQMINKVFLEHLSEELNPFSKGVSHRLSAEDSAQKHRDRGFNPDADSSNYSDIWLYSSTTHPDLNEIREWWYPDGTKSFPEGLDLTPTVVKYWYAGDGSLYWDTRNTETRQPHLEFGVNNEMHRPEYLEALFESKGFSATLTSNKLHFTADSTRRLLDWMGDPPSGFEYKWEIDSYGRYNQFKEESPTKH